MRRVDSGTRLMNELSDLIPPLAGRSTVSGPAQKPKKKTHLSVSLFLWLSVVDDVRTTILDVVHV
ncbi:MAG: hypothetical protein JWO47_940 [Candidatus Saccharibacteria bacterium]|nr:hypothetical protein [Candidatus Saccharibacteria bacterium]